jgi:putative ABC transport system permease protein
MIRNYLKIAFRVLQRGKLSAFINVFGLALAMACSMLIYVYIADELAYDRYHSNHNRIYRVTRDFRSPDGTVSLHLGHLAAPFGPLLKNDFPELEAVVRTLKRRLLVALLSPNGEISKSFYEPDVYFAEPEILKIFSIPVVSGSADGALGGPLHVMLSETTARKYFATDSPLGKSIRLGDVSNAMVSGVFADFPDQSHWHPEILVSFSTLNDSTFYGRKQLETNFRDNSFGTYVLVQESFDPKSMETQFPDFLNRHLNRSSNDPKASSWTTLFLQPLTDIHLRSHLDSEEEVNGNVSNVYMMGVISVFIMLIACFNFVNLSTARASKRAREVGLRKVAGAHRHQLIYQYLSESVLIAMIALVVALAFSTPAMFWLNAFTDKSLDINVFLDGSLLTGLVLFAACVGLVAGIYPAFILSGFKPALTLKGQHDSATGKGILRKGLVVAQFSISIGLIIATVITFQQLNYLNRLTLGYSKDQVVTLPYYNEEINPRYEAFYAKLTGESAIENVARSSLIPTSRLLDYQGSARIHKGDSIAETDVVLKNVAIDSEFFDTYEVAFVAGRDYSKELGSDSFGFVLNEAAVKVMGFTPEDIVNHELEYGGVRGTVIGVVKDFHFESLHEAIVPVIFHSDTRFNQISVKLNGNNAKAGIANIEKVWREFLPNIPFDIVSLSETYSNLYQAEQRQSRLFIVFAGLAILIACLGLFGLATFNTMQRIKEIGVRKVLGASVGSILGLLSREIVMLIMVSNVIAWPVAWYVMNEWLLTFAFHVSMNPVAYVLAAIAALGIALVTVSAQTIQAATSNPANTLRHE